MIATKKGPPIAADAGSCFGCLVCELRCSLRFQKAFNLCRAQIKVRRLVGKDTEFAISFTSECDNCGICARFCPYGALTQETEKGAD